MCLNIYFIFIFMYICGATQVYENRTKYTDEMKLNPHLHFIFRCIRFAGFDSLTGFFLFFGKKQQERSTWEIRKNTKYSL